jgi:L-ascorbate metabolism protein UlaG (beta-lactamase superfamily)
LQLTWVTHSCIRIENDGFTIVVDPGFTVPDGTLNDADAVLVTHEHGDHFQPAMIAARVASRPHLPVYTNKSVAALLDGSGAKVHAVGNGDAFTLGGVHIQVHGEWHAEILRESARVRNVGFQFGRSVFHPGDAYTDPHERVGLLMVPEFGLFTRMEYAFDYIKQVKPGQAAPVHDTGLDPQGLAGVDDFLNATPIGPFSPGTGIPFTRLTKLRPINV